MTINTHRRTLMNAGGALALSSVLALALAKPKERGIKVVAKKFEFLPHETHLKQGETVVLQFTAPEVPMGFSLHDFSQGIDIMPGKIATLQFTPDKTGSFDSCAICFAAAGTKT